MQTHTQFFSQVADIGDSGLAAGGQIQGGIPEKFQVNRQDGSMDVEASSLKLSEAYSHLEKRMGSGDLPPRSADEYQFNLPDAFKDTDFSGDKLMTQFKQEALSKGLTQEQFDFVMGKYFAIAPGLMAGARQISMDDCVSDLKTEWKSDAQYRSEMRKAQQAVQVYGDKDAQGLINDYGNDPRFVRFCNRVGAELGEDHSINPGGTQQGGYDAQTLMASEAYNNPKHADHARVSAQVRAHFESLSDSEYKSGRGRVL